MTTRITDKDLNRMLTYLNENVGIYDAAWNRVGCYQLEYAYGGVKLVQVINEHGAQRDVSRHGFGTKKELYIFMQGMAV